MIELYSEPGLLNGNYVDNNKKLEQWCHNNCMGYFHKDILPLYTRWSFIKKVDAIAFKLKWL